MESHLSNEQLESLLAGAPEQMVLRHVSRCERCAAEVDASRSMFAALRGSATAAAERHHRLASLPARREIPRMAWAGAMAALLLAVAVPVATHHSVAPPPPQQAPVTVAAMSDDALLSNIQNDLSTSVPEPLAPLTNTSTSTSTSTDQRTSQ